MISTSDPFSCSINTQIGFVRVRETFQINRSCNLSDYEGFKHGRPRQFYICVCVLAINPQVRKFNNEFSYFSNLTGIGCRTLSLSHYNGNFIQSFTSSIKFFIFINTHKHIKKRKKRNFDV
jgi:hypothetical protein